MSEKPKADGVILVLTGLCLAGTVLAAYGFFFGW